MILKSKAIAEIYWTTRRICFVIACASLVFEWKGNIRRSGSQQKLQYVPVCRYSYYHHWQHFSPLPSLDLEGFRMLPDTPEKFNESANFSDSSLISESILKDIKE